MLLKLGKVLHGMQKEQKEKKGEEGFTLIELLVVVIIIGILAAVAIPVFLGQRTKAVDAAGQANVREAATAIQVYWTEEGTAPADAAALAGKGFQQTDPPVTITASAAGASATFCASTPTTGGTSAFQKMTQADGAPVGSATGC